MLKAFQSQNTKFIFKRWTRKKFAVLASFGKIIKIGVLAFTMILVNKPRLVFSQTPDTLASVRNIDLEEVEIISEGTPEVFSQIARTITVITANDISSSPAATIQDLLEEVAGVDIRQRNIHGVQADIQIRGSTFDQVLVLLNGVNVTDPQTGHFNLNLPTDLSSIKKIEILHGSGARLYGANAYKGVINIITKTDFTGFKAGLEMGEYGLSQSNAGLGVSLKKQYHSMYASRNISDGYTQNTDFNLRNLFYQGGAKLENTNISWQGGVNRKKFGANDFYSPVFPNQYEETGTMFGSAGMETTGRIKFSSKLYFRRHKDRFLLERENPAFYENFHQTDVLGCKLHLHFSSDFGYTYVGYEGRHENILSNRLGETSEDPIRVKGTEDKFYTKGFSRMNNGLFLEQKYSTGSLYVSGGFLLNYNHEYPDHWSIFPGLDASYQLKSLNMKLFGSIGRSLRLPTFTDMFYVDPSNVGNPELQPEELVSIESGIEYSFSDFSSSISFFEDHGKKVIDWVLLEESSVYHASNIDKMFSRGIDFNLSYENFPAASAFHLKKMSLAYSFISKNLDPDIRESKYAGDYLKHQITGSINIVILKDFSLDYRISYLARNGSYPDYDESKAVRFMSEFEPYWISNTKMSYNKKSYSIYLKASNLFDVEYKDVGSLVQPGRWISAGIEARLGD